MVRGQPTRRIARAVAIACSGAMVSACSLVLDWSEHPDAGLDPTACSFKEPDDTRDTAMPLDPTEVGPGAICPAGDLDFYRFNVPVDGQVVTLDIQFTDDNPVLQDLDLFLYDSTGMVLSSGVVFNQPEERIVCPGMTPTCAQLVAGDYVLEVLGSGAMVFNSYTLHLAITPP